MAAPPASLTATTARSPEMAATTTSDDDPAELPETPQTNRLSVKTTASSGTAVGDDDASASDADADAEPPQSPPPTSPPAVDTSDDDGVPSPSPHVDLLRSLGLIEDERHLVAYDLHKSARERVELWEKEGPESFRARRTGERRLSEERKAASPLRARSPTRTGNDGGGPPRGGAGGTATTTTRRRRTNPGNNAPPAAAAARSSSVATTPPAKGGVGRGGLRFRSIRRSHVASSIEEEKKEAEEAAAIEAEMEEHRKARRVLDARAEEFDKLEKRALLFQRAKQNLTIDDDWTLAQTLFGITTYYRREPDHSLSVKLEGDLIGVPLFEQMAVLRECDLYHHWAPFCAKSRKLAQLGKIDVVAWFLTGLPKFGLSRDAAFRAVGCDSMREDGSIMLVGEGLGDKEEDGVKDDMFSDDDNSASPPDAEPARRESSYSFDVSGRAALVDTSLSSYLSRDSILDTIEIPPVPHKFGSGRMTIRSFQAVIDVLSPSSARTRVVANVDPNLKFLPQSLIDYCMKKMCGVLLSRLQGTARKILKDPVRNPHARRMREDVNFYRHWLLPKFKNYCDDLGWDMPPVGAFEVTEEELDEEELILWEGRSYTFDGGGAAKRRDTMGLLDHQRSTASEPPGVGARLADRSSNLEEIDDDDDTGLPRQSAKAAGRQPQHARSLAASATSDLTNPTLPTVTNTTWDAPPRKANPVSRFLTAMERRAETKKARAVSAARRKAARRLKPAPLTPEQKTRVEVLKKKKAEAAAASRSPTCAREAGDDGSVGTASASRSVCSWSVGSGGGGVRGGDATPAARRPTIWSVAVPTLTLFAVQFSDPAGFVEFLTTPGGGAPSSAEAESGARRWEGLGRALGLDALTVAILALFAALHFWTLNSLAVYAFDTIDLGQSKSGAKSRGLILRQVKRRVLAASCCAVVGCMLWAWIGVGGRWGAYYVGKLILRGQGTVQAFEMAWMERAKEVLAAISETGPFAKALEALSSLPERVPFAITGLAARIVSWLASAVPLATKKATAVTKATLSAATHLLGITTLGNHWLPRLIVRALSAALGLIPAALWLGHQWMADVLESTAEGAPLAPGSSWRCNALRSARTIISYSVVFVCSVMVMAAFMLPVKKEGKGQRQTERGNDATSSAGSSTSPNRPSPGALTTSPSGYLTASMSLSSIGSNASASALSFASDAASSLSSTPSQPSHPGRGRRGEPSSSGGRHDRMLASREEVIHEESEEDLLEFEEAEGDVARQQWTEQSKQPFPHSRNERLADQAADDAEGAGEGRVRKQRRRKFGKTIKKLVPARKKT